RRRRRTSRHKRADLYEAKSSSRSHLVALRKYHLAVRAALVSVLSASWPAPRAADTLFAIVSMGQVAPQTPLACRRACRSPDAMRRERGTDERHSFAAYAAPRLPPSRSTLLPGRPRARFPAGLRLRDMSTEGMLVSTGHRVLTGEPVIVSFRSARLNEW